MEEIFLHLGEIVFGTDMVGENAYYLLESLIWGYKINPNQGIKEWSNKVKILQTYIPYVPNKVLDRRGMVK